jgi:hypothetical protein
MLSNNYFYGGLNTDDTERLIPEGDYRSAFNIRGNEAGESNKGALESMTGNLLMDNSSLNATQEIIGSCKWIERNALVYFVCSTDPDNIPHSIGYYDVIAQTHTLIIQDNLLNFQLDYPIIHSNIVNNILYWTDGWFESYLEGTNGYREFNPPRMLNIDKALAGYGAITYDLLSFIKAPVSKEIDVEYDTSGDESNLLYGQTYQFAVQWVYENNERAVWNVTSKVPVPTKWEFVQGRNFLTPAEENVITMDVPTGSEQVKILRVAVRKGNFGQFEIFSEIDKTLSGVGNDTTITVNYDGSLAGQAVPLVEGIRNYDRVPQIASCQEVLTTKQMCFSNIVEGYDGVDLEDTQMVYLTTEIPYQVYGRNQIRYQKDEVVVPFTSPLKIFNVAPLQYFGYVEGDIIMFQFPTEFNATLNAGINDITIYYTVTAEDIQNIQGIGTVAGQLVYIVNTVGEYVADELQARGYPNTFSPTASPAIACEIDFTSSVIIYGLDDGRSAGNYAKNAPIKSLKQGVIHEFGIQYYDDFMRSGGVLEDDNFKLFVEFPTSEPSTTTNFIDPASPYFVRPYITGSHTPPDWARYYQIVWKPTRIADFQQRTVIKLETVPNIGMIKISLDTYYETQFGAKINHTIQVGDIVRIKTQKSYNITDLEGGLPRYSTTYVEMQVQKYEEAGGADSSEAIYVQIFDYFTVCNGTESFVLEIYSPRKEFLDAPYYEIGEVYDIIDPYTEDRHHGGQTYTGTVISSPTTGGDTFVVSGDARPLGFSLGFEITFTPTVGTPFTTTSSNITYNYSTNESTITTNDVSDGTTYATYSFTTEDVSTKEFACYLNFGDVYVRPRITNRYPQSLQGNFDWRYWVEDPHISDYFVSNFIDIGKLGIIDRLGGRKELTASGIHGGSYIDNTNNNNICSFDFNPLNKYDLDESYGAIRRTLMNGYTLKTLQDRKETSIYIQRTMAVGADGGQNVSYTDRTFGGINPYDSNYGTIHPTSVELLEGAMYYYDYYSSKFVKSTNNGQIELSQGKYKLNAFTTDLTNKIRNSSYKVVSAIDEQNREYQCFFREVAEVDEPYNIGIIYSLEDDRWKSFVDYVPTWGDNLGNVQVLWKREKLYVSNEGVNLNFFDEDLEASVKYCFNENPDNVKQPLAHIVRSYPKLTELVAEIPPFANYSEMRTRMAASLFKNYENGFNTEYRRDELDPRFSSEQLARINGRELRGYFCFNTIKYVGTDKIVIFSAGTTFIPSPALV